MKIVEMICGAYGYKAPGSRYVDLKTTGDRFEEVDEKADRLVQIGIGRIVEELGKAQAKEAEPTAEAEPEEEESLEYLSKAELKAMADRMGLSVSGRASKAELLEAIKEADGGFPDLNTEDPV